MHSKTGPDLIRQTITRFWQYNIYVQKPFDSGYSFLALFKLLYIIEFFFSIFRPSKLFIRNKHFRKIIKKAIYRLIEPSTFKLINFRINKNYKNLFLFCNIGSRSHMFPKIAKNLNYSSLKFKFKKKLNFFRYTFFLIKNRFFNSSFIKSIKYKKILTIKEVIKFKNFKNFYFLIKNKNRFFNLNQKHKLKNGTIKYWKLNIKNKKEIFRWFFDSKFFNRLIIRGLNKRQILPSKKVKYAFKKLKKLKKTKKKNKKYNLLKNFLKIIILKKSKSFKKYLTLKSLISKIKYFKLKFYKYKKKKKNFFVKIKKKPKKFFPLFKSIFNTKTFLIINKKNLLQKKKLKNSFKFNLYTIMNLKDSLNFIYFQFFNKILEHKLENFLINTFKIKNLNIRIQQEFVHPRANYVLQLFNKRMRENTFFLRSNNKFYNNFVNILPLIQTFNSIFILAKQIAFELERTKKHWRVIRGIELIIMQSFIQLKKEPIESKSNLIGLRVTITGRPNKSARTKKIVFQFGRITKASFSKYNVFETTTSANAQIGTFGITITALT